LGSAYNRLGRYPEAAAELETAVRLGSNDAEVHYQLARAYGKLDRQDDRKQALARFSELTRKSNERQENRRNALKLVDEAKSLVDRGELEAAAARLEEARALLPADDKILFRLAGLHFDLKQIDSARSYAQEAISLAPTAWLYHYLLGLVEKSASRRREARESLELAIKLNTSAAEAHDALGELALEEGTVKEAVASFQRAVELDSRASYREHLAAAKRRLQVQ
jgi:tetratricopeptide (TPR) repeat protein